MVIEPLSLKKEYWQDFEVTNKDLDFLYNYLLEIETPQTSEALTKALVVERIRIEKESLESKQQANGAVYYPKDHYQVGQTIQFPALNWQTGTVVSTRPGQNPDMAPFGVIEVELSTGEKRQFAADLESHKLNQPVSVNSDDPLLDFDYVMDHFGEDLIEILSEEIQSNPGLVRIAGKWFPRALLVDINIGHLNLAEAVLDMIGGGPLPTAKLMEQIDLPEDASSNFKRILFEILRSRKIKDLTKLGLRAKSSGTCTAWNQIRYKIHLLFSVTPSTQLMMKSSKRQPVISMSKLSMSWSQTCIQCRHRV